VDDLRHEEGREERWWVGEGDCDARNPSLLNGVGKETCRGGQGHTMGLIHVLPGAGGNGDTGDSKGEPCWRDS